MLFRSDDALIPATLPSAVVSWSSGIRRVIAAWPIPHLLEGVSRLLFRGSLPIISLPLAISVLVPLWAVISLSLAIGSTRLLLIHRSYMIRTIPVIRLVIPSLVPEILAVIPPGWPGTAIAGIPLTRLNRVQQGLSWITQSITIRNPDGLGQGGRHLPL